jgi:hypothetical protein
VVLDAVLLIRALFARPVRHRAAIGGMALFWAGDALAAWSALAASGVLMNGAALLVGYCTGMVATRRTAPLAGAGTLALILPLTIWASGAPLATAITGVAACRLLGGWLLLPPALASLPVLRETSGRPCPAPLRDPVPRPVTPQRPRAAPDPASSPAMARLLCHPATIMSQACLNIPRIALKSAPGRPPGGRDPAERPGRAGRHGPADHDGRLGGAERLLDRVRCRAAGGGRAQAGGAVAGQGSRGGGRRRESVPP